MEVESPTLSPLSFRRAFSCQKLFQNWECTSKLSLIVISCFSDMEDKKGKMTIFFRNTKKILWKQPFQSREINRKGGNGCFEKTRKVKWQNIPLQWYSLDNIWNLQYFGKVNFQHKKVCSSSKPKKKINLPDKFEKGSLPRLILKGFLETFQSVKSGRIRSYSGVHFPALGLNTERYEISKCGKMRTRITPNTDIFHAVIKTTLNIRYDIDRVETITEIFCFEQEHTVKWCKSLDCVT